MKEKSIRETRQTWENTFISFSAWVESVFEQFYGWLRGRVFFSVHDLF